LVESTTVEARLSIATASDLIARRELSPVDLVRSVLDQVDRLEPRVRAYATLLPEQALAAARAAERDIAHGTYRGPLHGIPVALKDLIDTAGIPTTWGSQAHPDRVPTTDAKSWQRLQAAGAILIGKSVTHEMGCGTQCPPTCNPLALDRGPGGSSGGSAAALAAGMCLGALGTDTGGSIRIPAACTGTVGLKPTYGLVPTDGAFVASWTLDHVGPMANAVEDVALLLDALTQSHVARVAGLDGLRLGVPEGLFREHVQPDVLSAFDTAVARAANDGAHVARVDLAPLAAAPEVGSLIACPELFAGHGDDLAHADLLGDQTRLNLEQGAAEPAHVYAGALRTRQEMQLALRSLFDTHSLDAILTPTLPITAARKDQTSVHFDDGYEEKLEAAYVRFCVAWNVTGVPALSLPCGRDGNGLPVGLQVVGRPFAEATVLRIGRELERLTL
jgi:aspartyl-tRNA(Asn)/glutamyl-tRNA(Gln) amidotransferase subunit A